MIKKINIMSLIYFSLIAFSFGLFTSMTLTALLHILILIPSIYFLNKTNFKKWEKSTWFLLFMAVAFILSVVMNQDIAFKGFQPILKTKYYLFGVITIAPFSYFFSKLSPEERTEKIKLMLKLLIITTTVAGLFGMFSIAVKFNFFKWEINKNPRNSGFAGMLLNYAHNLALFQVLLTGLILYKDEAKKYFKLNFLYFIWIVNFIALFTTYSRGPLLAFIISAPLYLIKINKKLLAIVFGMIILVSTVVYFQSATLSKRGQRDGRISQWNAAIAGFKERPVFGLGYLNFEPLSISLKEKYHIEGSEWSGHAHSNYFEILASTGIVGFLFFMLWQIFWIIELWKNDNFISRLCMPFAIAFIIGGLTQATFTLGANLFFIMTVYSLTKVNSELVISDKASIN